MWLLDGNLLVALAIDSHEFHDRAQQWFDLQTGPFATCAITEGTLLRVHMTVAQDRSAAAAWSVLEAIHDLPDHVFWNDGFSYRYNVSDSEMNRTSRLILIDRDTIRA